MEYTFTLLMVCESSLVDPLQDGLLITKIDKLRIQLNEWTILVTSDFPSVDPELSKQVTVLIIELSQSQTWEVLPGPMIRAWISCLQSVQTYLHDNQYTSPIVDRQRRSPFNFVGELGHSLFGLAIDSSIKECIQAVMHV